MSKLEFKELLDEYISKLEKDYTYNLSKNNHPIFSVLQNTYTNLRRKYFFRWTSIIVMSILTVFLFYFNFFNNPALNLAIQIFSFFLVFSIFYIITHYFIKLPDIEDVNIIADRILLVREKIKNFDFDFFTVKAMIIDINSIYNTERMAYLKKYYELAKPEFDGNRNKNTNYESNPIDRMIAIDQIIDTTKIPIPIDEKELLLSCLLRFSYTNYSNVETLFRVLTKYKEKEELKENETSKLKALKKSLGNTVNILTKATQSTEAIYSSLPKMN